MNVPGRPLQITKKALQRWCLIAAGLGLVVGFVGAHLLMNG